MFIPSKVFERLDENEYDFILLFPPLYNLGVIIYAFLI